MNCNTKTIDYKVNQLNGSGVFDIGLVYSAPSIDVRHILKEYM